MGGKVPDNDDDHVSVGPDVLLFSSPPNPAPPVDPALDALTRTDLRIDADVTEARMQGEQCENLSSFIAVLYIYFSSVCIDLATVS